MEEKSCCMYVGTNRPQSLDGPQGSALSIDLKKTLPKPNNTSHCRNRMTSTFLEIISKGR